MEEFPEDGAISFFEDLDPEPQAEQGQARKREFTIGVVLIMFVLVWVGSQWLRTQQEAKQYHSAQAAAATHDWQTAYALFNGVSDFSDASQRAAEAKKNLDERNTQYEKAREASGKGDWVTALQAARDVAQIQPGYFNSSVIAADAVSHLTDTALDGSVALLPGDNAGLYYRAGGQWLRLQGSDAVSTVRGLGPKDGLVYDAPDPRVGRKVIAAHFSNGHIAYTPLAFDADLYSFFVWGGRGVWGLKYNYGPLTRLGLRNEYNGYAVDYQSFNSASVQPLASPPGSTLMDLAQSGDKVLLGVTATVSNTMYASLYSAAPDGTAPVILFSGKGSIRSAHFSPDGRYILASLYESAADYRTQHISELLIQPAREGQNNTEVTVLAQHDAGADTGQAFPVLGATFLREGTLAGKVLLSEWNQGLGDAPSSSVFTVIDPQKPGTTLMRAQTDSRPVSAAFVSETGSSVLVAWQDGLNGSYPYAQRMVSVRMTLGQSAVIRRIMLGRGETLQGAVMRGDKIVFATRKASSSDTELVTVRGAQLDNNTPRRVKTDELYSATQPKANSFSYGQEWGVGLSRLAYLDSGQLHVHTLQGSEDILLGTNIKQLYTFPYTDLHWLR